MSYGAFVKLEDGIEGLVHISEMSWTKRISHPSEMVQIDDEVEVMVLDINEEKQEISLGMKQTQDNPWDKVADRYPPGELVTGKVRNLTNYGAFIEIEEGIDGLLHVSDMSWTRKIGHPSEVVEKGQEVECKVVSVDQERRRIALGLKQMDEDPWATDIPNRYQPGQLRDRHGDQDHQLRRVRRLGRRPRGTAAHLGAGGPQGREPRGRGEGRRGDRSEDSARRHRRAEDRLVSQASRMGRASRAARTVHRRATTAAPAVRLRNSRAASAPNPARLFKPASPTEE